LTVAASWLRALSFMRRRLAPLGRSIRHGRVIF
jgi:hypothetical protein